MGAAAGYVVGAALAALHLDPESAAAYWHPDVVWHDAPELPDRGTHRGREALLERLNSFRAVLGELPVEILEIAERDNKVLGKMRRPLQGARSGARMDRLFYQVVLVEDGLIVEVYEFLDGAEAAEVAGLP